LNQSIESSKVKLFKYEDIIGGPRRLPNVENIFDGKVEINSKSKLSVLFDSNEINIEDNGTKQNIGKQLIYFVEEN
jgi:hypothetical protein